MTRIELVDGVACLPRAEWNAMVGDGSPFLEWDWLASLEEAGCVGPETGWLPRPLVARDDAGRLVAACPVYVKGHSEGEFVFDWGWADAAYNAGIEYYPKLLVGVPFTPVTGSRFLVAPDADRSLWTGRLAGALRDLCERNGLSSAHVNFCSEAELEILGEEGYLSRVGIQYHWHNDGYRDFEDYLQRFRSKRRNQIRRERRELESQGVTLETLVGDQIGDELFEPMFEFYLSTIRSRYWGRQYLNRRLFELAAERFRHNLVFVVARQGGEPVAGTFNVAKGDAMYGRYWGAKRRIRHLHFNVCYYAAVEHCIDAGLDRFEPGAGGEYKQVRGFDARPTYSGHFLRDPRLAAAIRRFLERERREASQTLEWYEDESALKPR
ncbi:MAG: GNAT family N-acetyltransferase [Myxococcota bacterium]